MKHFKAGLLWEQNRQKTSKTAGKQPFWAFFTKHKNQNTGNKKQKHQKTKKTYQKNTLLHSGKPPPIFVKFLVFIKVHSFRSTKLCFAENTIKIVFSAKHSFQASQIVKPLFEGKPKMALLQPKVPF